jgi:hypothetical protein
MATSRLNKRLEDLSARRKLFHEQAKMWHSPPDDDDDEVNVAVVRTRESCFAFGIEFTERAGGEAGN